MALTIVKRPNDAPGGFNVPKWYANHLYGRPDGLTVGVFSDCDLSGRRGGCGHKPNVCGLILYAGGDGLGGSEEGRYLYIRRGITRMDLGMHRAPRFLFSLLFFFRLHAPISDRSRAFI